LRSTKVKSNQRTNANETVIYAVCMLKPSGLPKAMLPNV